MQSIPNRWAWLAISGLVAASACNDSSSPSETTGVVLAAVDSGYDFSVFLTAPPGDTHRLMVVERGGRIWLTRDGVRQTTPFLNLSSLTGQGHEYGVYSLAFHPQYQQNRRFFVYYVDNNANTRVAEFLANPDFDSADPASQKVILGQSQSATAVLYGGMIAFGTDGELYVGLGDGDVGGAPVSRAQDSTSLLGKILRLDVDGAAPYEIPADNPYVGRPGWRSEIWQLGLRNPWRWSFDRGNGDLYIGDVGEDLWEEVDHFPAPVVGGNNFGWPIEEGKNCFQPSTNCFTLGLVEPVFEYPHGRACAVTGGYVYRGQDFPELQGTYFYGDFCSGVIRSFLLDGEYPQEELAEIAIPTVNGKADNTVSFGEDGRGELYAVMASGRIYRVEKR
jgi:hypothetical protein